MSCVHMDDHKTAVRRAHLLHLNLHGIGIILLMVCLYALYDHKREQDSLRKTVDTLRIEYSSMKMKQQMLSLLRTRPLTVGQAMGIAEAVTQQNNVPVEVVLAIMKQESEFIPEAVSNKGAKGLMQIMPVVWKSYSPPHFKNLTDPVQNVHVGTSYLAHLYQRYEDWPAVFRAYYAGPENSKNRKYDWYASAVTKKMADVKRELEN